MGNREQIKLIKQGSKTWNTWRKQYAKVMPNLSGADLSSANLSNANLSNANLSMARLSKANFSKANLVHANLWGADFRGADLRGAHLYQASLYISNLSGANFSGAILIEAGLRDVNLRDANLFRARLSNADLSNADLQGANLQGANLSNANLSGANLQGANLSKALLVETNFTQAILTHCSIYGISVWKVQLQGAQQENLTITSEDESIITVDNLEVAQFIYLLLNNPKIRDVIDTIARKAVLILGRFTPERKQVLDALRDELRIQNYLPIVFDFERPASRDLTETVSTLAHLSRFIIADLTHPSSIPQELATIVPFTIVPVQPLLIQDEARQEYAMFQDLRRRYHWVLPTFRYQNTKSLLASLKMHIIKPAELKAQELEKQ